MPSSSCNARPVCMCVADLRPLLSPMHQALDIMPSRHRSSSEWSRSTSSSSSSSSHSSKGSRRSSAAASIPRQRPRGSSPTRKPNEGRAHHRPQQGNEAKARAQSLHQPSHELTAGAHRRHRRDRAVGGRPHLDPRHGNVTTGQHTFPGGAARREKGRHQTGEAEDCRDERRNLRRGARTH